MLGVRECRVARRSDLASMRLGECAAGINGVCGVVSASSSCGGGNGISLDAGQTFLIAFDCDPPVSGGSRSLLGGIRGGSRSLQEASRSVHGGGECGDSGQSDRSRFTHRRRSRTGQTNSGETQRHRRIAAGHRHHCLRRNQDIGRSPHHRSRRTYRASQPFGAHDQFRRLDHPHVESEAGRRPRLPSLGEDRHQAPPASASELHYLATDTRTSYVAQFDPADADKTAYYWLRWENTKGETGPWSAVVSATITG